jgi:hypothetical protein
MAEQQPRFLGLPKEISLQIYHLLLDDKGQTALEIRNEYPNITKETRCRTNYNLPVYRALRYGCSQHLVRATYYLQLDVEIYTAIMRVNCQIHGETSYLIYGCHTFSFGGDVEAIVPFSSKPNRPLIHEIALVKQGPFYSREYDIAEWYDACRFIREHMHVESLKLVVEGGSESLPVQRKEMPGYPEYSYSVSDYRRFSGEKFKLLEWAWELLTIKGIKKLDVKSKVLSDVQFELHLFPLAGPAGISPMHWGYFAVGFGASIETGFADFLRSEMIKDA